MDHFFASVASLMSRNVRSAVYNSITDLVQFLEMYKLGNDFTGPFERSLPVLPQPIVLTVVRITLSTASKQVLLERRTAKETSCEGGIFRGCSLARDILCLRFSNRELFYNTHLRASLVCRVISDFFLVVRSLMWKK